MTQTTFPFAAVGRLPLPVDNVAIATRTLPAGTIVEQEGHRFTLNFTVLEGHRFAVAPIAPGEPLLSWDVPFGIASRAIEPGDYVCNAAMLTALQERSLDLVLPTAANFNDRIVPHELDPATFTAGQQVTPHADPRTFLGYRRAGDRGVGTRNVIVILGTTSSTASYVRALADSLQPAVAAHANIDGIVPIAHTEGSGYAAINNRDFLLRTLAGLVVHPNVAAVLAVDLATDAVNNQQLEQYLRDGNYPLDAVPHAFFTRTGQWDADLAAGAAIVNGWLPGANGYTRTPESVAHLALALQCGGSDAFSGVSGNPLASNMAKAVIRHGGRANLAETDELIGSEAYALQNVRDLPTAQKFLNFIAEFKERLAWHGQSAEGNPSGGNKLRGLYNIALKSIGAAMKRHPDVRLDHVIDYGERMDAPGFYFMNSPGNDLESIAGQVASGANLIIFITGNGSITNFPFVPTIKVMTTTQRYELLSAEMDIDAGRYLTGTPMAELTAESVDLLVEIASGQHSCGEAAGHSQISIWRNWQQQDRSRLPLLLNRDRPTGRPIAVTVDGTPTADLLPLQAARGAVNLILPTSLCSGQIARLATDQLQRHGDGPNESEPNGTGLPAFATLVHTEGCGVAFASTREVYAETMVGHAAHPLVARALFLEHGCEKAHNDYLHSLLVAAELDPTDFGWASVQLDGGIQQVLAKIRAYFEQRGASEQPLQRAARPFTLALLANGAVPPLLAGAMAQVAGQVVAAGGSVVVPNQSALVATPAFSQPLGLSLDAPATLAYGQAIRLPGFHLMEAPTQHWAETVTGLGATGAELILAHSTEPRPGHPFVPLVLVADDASNQPDLHLQGDPADWSVHLLAQMAAVMQGQQRPQTLAQNNVDFQLTRGWLGIST